MKNKLISLLLVLTMLSTMLTAFAVSINGDDQNIGNNDPFIAVTLGDSYASGEGNEPFYGQSTQGYDDDFIAHRSEAAWPGRLYIPGIGMEDGKTLKDYKVDYDSTSTDDIQWYFRAASGAKTGDFENKQLRENLNYSVGSFSVSGKNYYLDAQYDALDQASQAGQIDLVTLSIGGNDLGFADIIKKAALSSLSSLETTLKGIWQDIDTYMNDIEEVYWGIHTRSGGATIIVTGYPLLFDENPTGILISKSEAKLINSYTSAFNEKIGASVEKLRAQGMDIHYVDVETVFAGHGAFGSSEWINRIYISRKTYDVTSGVSGYSVHPNEKGQAAYAQAVNEKIAQLWPTIKIVESGSDTPVSGVSFDIPQLELHGVTGGEELAMRIPSGTYEVILSARGYEEKRLQCTFGDDSEFVFEIEKKIITVTYDANGGIGAPPAVTATDCAFTLATDQPSKVGYDFIGWAESADAAIPTYDLSQLGRVLSADDSLTLYAVWQAKIFKVYYDTAGGYIPGVTIADPYEYKVYDAEFTITVADPVRRGYIFNGWYDPVSEHIVGKQGDSALNIGDTSANDKTLAASWTKDERGDFDSDGEVGASDVMRIINYLAGCDYESGTSSVEINAKADMNNDGVINGKDLIMLARTLAENEE